MRAEIVGIPPVPTGLTWASGSIEFSFDPNWSDGVGRGPGTISGILQPTTKDKFVVPGSLSALFVPATPTGIGVIRGPLMAMRWILVDSQGREHRVDSVFPDSLIADASNLFNVNALGATPTYVTSAGPAPVGVDIATGDARYVRFTSLATTSAVGVVQLATSTEAITGTDGTRATTSAAVKAAGDRRVIVTTTVTLLQGVDATARGLGVALAAIAGIGSFIWDAASLQVSNTTNVIRPADIAADATAGRWLLIGSNLNAVGAKSQKSVVQSIPNGGGVPVTFPTEDYDDLTFHDLVTNNSRFTIPAGAGGRYRVEISGQFINSTGAGERKIAIAVNGVETRAASGTPVTTVFTSHNASDTLPLVPGDYVELFASQFTGAALNLNYGTLAITRVR